MLLALGSPTLVPHAPAWGVRSVVRWIGRVGLLGMGIETASGLALLTLQTTLARRRPGTAVRIRVPVPLAAARQRAVPAAGDELLRALHPVLPTRGAWCGGAPSLA